MRVRMKTMLSGPSGNAHPGSVIDLPDDQAQAMINGRFAERVGPDVATNTAVVESATIAPAEIAVAVTSAATQPARNGRRGSR